MTQYDATLDPCSPDFDTRSWESIPDSAQHGQVPMLRALPDWLAQRARRLVASNRCGEAVGFRAETVDDPDRPGHSKVHQWELLGTSGSVYVDPVTRNVVRVRSTHSLP